MSNATPPSTESFLDLLIANKELMNEFIPYNKELGMEFLDLSYGKAHMRIPYDDKMIGDPETGVIHGGVLTAFLDGVCGTAVFTTLEELQPTATLDLRIDYMKPATPGLPIQAAAHCYKRTNSIAFVRATAFHETSEDPIATASAAFIIKSKDSQQQDTIQSRATHMQDQGEDHA